MSASDGTDYPLSHACLPYSEAPRDGSFGLEFSLLSCSSFDDARVSTVALRASSLGMDGRSTFSSLYFAGVFRV